MFSWCLILIKRALVIIRINNLAWTVYKLVNLSMIRLCTHYTIWSVLLCAAEWNRCKIIAHWLLDTCFNVGLCYQRVIGPSDKFMSAIPAYHFAILHSMLVCCHLIWRVACLVLLRILLYFGNTRQVTISRWHGWIVIGIRKLLGSTFWSSAGLAVWKHLAEGQQIGILIDSTFKHEVICTFAV